LVLMTCPTSHLDLRGRIEAASCRFLCDIDV